MSAAHLTPADISVVIPALDEASRLPRLLAALGGVGEVVVADGGSGDGTAELARASGAIVVQAPRGRGRQLAAGALAATRPVLWFLHADVVPPPEAAPRLIGSLRDAAIVGGAFTIHTVHDGGVDYGLALRIADLRSRTTRLPYGDQGLFVRRTAYDAAGGFAEVALMEDLDLSLRLRRVGRLVTVPVDLAVSGRRFGAGPYWAAACMWTFPTLWRLGVSPETLRRWYGDVR